ncbi:DUF1810 domain-containing protein [Polynucleobacter paneuropaeus]|jgi:uncharacterized protein (DUF1810 family)|nr:DUF1810 domain-containing protein [Polynucleobacter paneuropaeus]
MSDITLQRFLDAQAEPMMGWVLDELRAGHKKTHWMWFIFPQAYGLGESNNAKLYGIRSLGEARAYWAHPILGERLRQCIKLALDSNETALVLFGKEIDAMKFQSSLTLFLQIAPQDLLLQAALQRFFSSELDSKTLEIIKKTL